MKAFTTLMLVTALFFLFLAPAGVFGVSLEFVETITVDPKIKFPEQPWSFCVTEDGFFLVPDTQSGKVRIFKKDGTQLKYLKGFGPDGTDKMEFIRPMQLLYSHQDARLVVADRGTRQFFLFDRRERDVFVPIKQIKRDKIGSDINFTGFGKWLLISAYILNNDQGYGLYALNLDPMQKKAEEVKYIMPIFIQYGLANEEDYKLEFRKKKKLPAVGYKAYFDVQGDQLFIAWEANLRIIKLKLKGGERSLKKDFESFGKKTHFYKEPSADALVDAYKGRDFSTVRRLKEGMSYIKDIFALPQHVLLVYRTPAGAGSEKVAYRLQVYTSQGRFVKEMEIPGSPSWQMSFNKLENCLYAISGSGRNDGVLSIIKYQLYL